jgi:hypothetical protein
MNLNKKRAEERVEIIMQYLKENHITPPTTLSVTKIAEACELRTNIVYPILKQLGYTGKPRNKSLPR